MPPKKHYNNLSLKEKESRNRLHEPHRRCPACDMAIHPDDLLVHKRDRCKGRPEPHPRCKWLSWKQAIDEGLTKRSLSHMAATGKIRTRIKKDKKQYLKADVVEVLALDPPKVRLHFRPLPKAPKKVKETQRPLDDKAAKRLTAVVTLAGSQRAAAELTGVSLRTMRRAIHSKPLTYGTRLAIELGMDNALRGTE